MQLGEQKPGWLLGSHPGYRVPSVGCYDLGEGPGAGGSSEGGGSAGKLLNDGRLYENLLDSSQELSLALEQLKELAAQAREKGIKIKW